MLSCRSQIRLGRLHWRRWRSVWFVFWFWPYLTLLFLAKVLFIHFGQRWTTSFVVSHHKEMLLMFAAYTSDLWTMTFRLFSMMMIKMKWFILYGSFISLPKYLLILLQAALINISKLATECNQPLLRQTMKISGIRSNNPLHAKRTVDTNRFGHMTIWIRNYIKVTSSIRPRSLEFSAKTDVK